MTTTEMQSKIGSQLRILRINAGYVAGEKFSLDNGLNRTSYWAWENGRNITIQSFLRLLEIHNLTPVEFFKLIEERSNKQSNGKDNQKVDCDRACS